MKSCPVCNQRTSCVNSRANPDGNCRRRYECDCGHKYTTLEVVVDDFKHTTAEAIKITQKLKLKRKLMDFIDSMDEIE